MRIVAIAASGCVTIRNGTTQRVSAHVLSGPAENDLPSPPLQRATSRSMLALPAAVDVLSGAVFRFPRRVDVDLAARGPEWWLRQARSTSVRTPRTDGYPVRRRAQSRLAL